MQVLYCSVLQPGGPWCQVFDVRTGQQIEHVVEANALEDWVRVERVDSEGRPIIRAGEVVIDRFCVQIAIRLAATAPQWARQAFAYANELLTDG